LFPIELFEFDLVDYGLINWSLAPYFSRLLISFEVFLGIAFILNWRPRPYVYISSLLLMLMFTIFLFYRLFTGNGAENCGCFGSWLPMSVTASIIKNLVIIALILFLYKYNLHQWKIKREKIIIPLIFLGITSVVFAYRLPDDFYLAEEKLPLENNVINPDVFPPIIQKTDTLRPSEQKSFLVFFSATCEHCIKAARKLSIIHKQHPELKMLTYINGEKKEVPAFIEKTKLSLPYAIFNKREFVYLTQGGVPKIFFIRNFKITTYWGGEDFSEKELIRIWAE
ncbi:MAG: hypothetical protein IT239_01120, partial [Bacteroidia bacterium]|nr:hypothetical protein [Bacteroidia bacterium]